MSFLIRLERADWPKWLDTERIPRQAELLLDEPPVCITDARAENSPGTAHDYYSNGDYWWLNPDTLDGLPYVQRDGESNPGNFTRHRLILRQMRTKVSLLAAAYALTGEEKYAAAAVRFLQAFFLDLQTRMNPHLLYAQAIPGVCDGRGIGIIDTLHLIDIPVAVGALQGSAALTDEVCRGLKQWFADYLQWMSTHPHGLEERRHPNNHSICWYVQAAAFAMFTGHEDMLEQCRQAYKEVLLPGQMGADGSFPLELARTKPYSYSCFVLDNMVTLCHLLSTEQDNLWTYVLPDGRGIRKGLEFLYPYLADKEIWPYARDIEHFDAWPVGMSFLLFAGLALEKRQVLELWRSLDPDPGNEELRRNMAIRQPLLWLNDR
ncbi:alginate lyase family protein [Paenibacillus filicis]|uniref:Alginate lyase family protein n=1 Tax=Paenibacillus filicis TaxID=669464 RepID=A0ABU9DVS8_9BACL